MLITGGCGISQITWPQWPTWPKYCNMVYKCEHINLGAPAAGNWYIFNSISKKISESKNVDCVIVTWTNHDKLDLFVDQSNPIEKIKDFSSRNWILDWNGEITNRNEGFWPSSVSIDNEFKKQYKSWQNEYQHALLTFSCIHHLELLCKNLNIPLYNFMSYDLELNKYKNNVNTKWLVDQIDWKQWTTLEPLAQDYYQSNWFQYEITKQQGFIPVTGWHWEIFQKYIDPILSKYYQKNNVNYQKITDAANLLTKNIYNGHTNTLAS